MKRLKLVSVVFLFFLLFVGCSSIPEMQRQVIVTTFDFSKYSAENFLFTTESYLGNYDAIGLINATIIPEIKSAKHKEEIEGYYTTVSGLGYAFIEKVNPTMAIDEIYKKAVGMGANAVINFKSTSTQISVEGFSIPTYELTGFAIKRK